MNKKDNNLKDGNMDHSKNSYIRSFSLETSGSFIPGFNVLNLAISSVVMKEIGAGEGVVVGLDIGVGVNCTVGVGAGMSTLRNSDCSDVPNALLLEVTL